MRLPRRALRRLSAARAAEGGRRPRRGRAACTAAIGQPARHTHPHLIAEGELTVGIPVAEYERRRRVLLSALKPGTAVVLPTYGRVTMTNDIPWPFRPESNFFFLTGCAEPGACAVLYNDGSSTGCWELFVKEKDPSRELWDGVMTGPANTQEHFACDAAHDIAQLPSRLAQILERVKQAAAPQQPQVMLHGGINPDVEQRVVEGLRSAAVRAGSPAPILQALRAIKGAPQLAMQRRAAAISAECFRAAMRATRPGLSEHHLWAVMEFVARIQGAQGLAYPPVVAGGTNALSLHYVCNSQLLREGEMVLVDAGAEYHCHPSDVTRTWPVAGRFSDPQREVYSAVLRVQRELISLVRPGATTGDIHQRSKELIAEELLKLGVLSPNDGAAVTQAQSARVFRLYPHAFGHPMGMDIHERLPATRPPDTFTEGMMHTVEPGIYLPDDASIPDRYRGICVRIEDNVVLTADGCEVITAAIAKDPEEVEDWIQGGAGHAEDLVRYATNCARV